MKVNVSCLYNLCTIYLLSNNRLTVQYATNRQNSSHYAQKILISALSRLGTFMREEAMSDSWTNHLFESDLFNESFQRGPCEANKTIHLWTTFQWRPDTANRHQIPGSDESMWCCFTSPTSGTKSCAWTHCTHTVSSWSEMVWIVSWLDYQEVAWF